MYTAGQLVLICLEMLTRPVDHAVLTFSYAHNRFQYYLLFRTVEECVTFS